MSAAALAGFPARAFRTRVLAWYDAEGRTLPFRGTTDPYLILVSETILQQTQIARGAPAWEAFSARFPTVQSLAAASPADVLRAWRGLGYNRRALNLQRTARIVVAELGGIFPRDVAGLERLPGVGPYTARAVASIAHGRRVGAVDTNVRRVLGRAVAGDAAGLSARELQAVADTLASPSRPAAWTHALMDLGSALCRPRAPRCAECPVRSICRYTGRAGDRPADPTLGAARSTRDADAALSARPSRRGGPTAARERRAPFERTSRWLRGRILDRLRDADGDGWTALAAPIGSHDLPAVSAALTALAAEGLIELDSADRLIRARLPIA